MSTFKWDFFSGSEDVDGVLKQLIFYIIIFSNYEDFYRLEIICLKRNFRFIIAILKKERQMSMSRVGLWFYRDVTHLDVIDTPCCFA